MSNELIQLYQSNINDKEAEQKLLSEYRPYIQANINKWSGVLPQAVIEAHGKKYALDAFKTYDVNRGADIKTHLYNNISQLSRLVYEHQNAVRIPENQIGNIGKINSIKMSLEDNLGREPTIDEIADYSSLPKQHIEKILKNQRADFINDSDTEYQQFATRDLNIPIATKIISYRNKLPSIQQKQFDLLTGFNKVTPLSAGDFGKQFKLKPYEVSRLKQFFAKGLK